MIEKQILKGLFQLTLQQEFQINYSQFESFISNLNHPDLDEQFLQITYNLTLQIRIEKIQKSVMGFQEFVELLAKIAEKISFSPFYSNDTWQQENRDKQELYRKLENFMVYLYRNCNNYRTQKMYEYPIVSIFNHQNEQMINEIEISNQDKKLIFQIQNLSKAYQNPTIINEFIKLIKPRKQINAQLK